MGWNSEYSFRVELTYFAIIDTDYSANGWVHPQFGVLTDRYHQRIKWEFNDQHLNKEEFEGTLSELEQWVTEKGLSILFWSEGFSKDITLATSPEKLNKPKD